MALKESESAMAEAAAKLQLKQKENKQSADPWGSMSAESSVADKPAVFNPFSAAGPSTSSNHDPWGISAPPVVVAAAVSAPVAVSSDPWSQAVNVPAAGSNTATRSGSFSDLFASETPSAPPQPAASADPWGVSSSADLFSAPAPTPVVMAMPTFTTPSVDPFAAQPLPSPHPFDPLAEFDNLHVSSNGSLSAPVASDRKLSPVMDPFMLEPTPVHMLQQPMMATTNNGGGMPSAVDSKANNFLEGSLNDLVNLDSLLPSKKANNPYAVTRPESKTVMSNRNPFLQKAPALSLNAMQGGSTGSGFNVSGVQDFPFSTGPTQHTGAAASPFQQQQQSVAPFFGQQQQQNFGNSAQSNANLFSSIQNPF